MSINTSKYLNNMAVTIQKPLSVGSSCTVIAPPKLGKTAVLRTLLLKSNKYFDSNYQFIWLPLAPTETEQLKNIAEQLNIESVTWTNIEDKIRSQIELGKKFVFVLDDANILFDTFNSIVFKIYNLTREVHTKIHFIFIVSGELADITAITKPNYDIYSLIVSHVIYMSLFDEDESLYILNKGLKDISLKLDDSYKEVILKLSGGHAGLLKALLRLVALDTDTFSDNALLKHMEIKTLLLKLWNSMSVETQKECIKNDKYINDYLVNSHMKNKNGKWFSDLFKKFVKDLDSVLDNNDIETSLTFQELQVYKLLVNQIDTVVTRDQIAQCIWKTEWEDKYSDWAIDKLLSQLRKKLSNKKAFSIKTVYGKGFILSKLPTQN